MLYKNKNLLCLATAVIIVLLLSGYVSGVIIKNDFEKTVLISGNSQSGPFKYENRINYDFGFFTQEGIATDNNGHFFISTARTLIDGKITVAEIRNNDFVKSSINGIKEIDIGWHTGDPFCDETYLFVPWIEWNGIIDPTKTKCYVYTLSDLTELEKSPYDLKIGNNYLPGASSGAYYKGKYYISSYFPTDKESKIFKFSFNKDTGFIYQEWQRSLGKSEVQGIEFLDNKCYFIRAHGSDPNVYWINTNKWDSNSIAMQNIMEYTKNINGPYEGLTFDKSNPEKIKAYFGFGNYNFESFEHTNLFSDSNLDCEGSLNFKNVCPGSVVSGEFILKNNGLHNSLLHWEIDHNPDWTIFFIDPLSSEEKGQEPLECNDEITIEVSIVVPFGEKNYYSGDIKVVNLENSADYSNIDVEITTSKSKPNLNFINNWIFQLLFNKLKSLKSI